MSDFDNISDDEFPKKESPKMTCEEARVLSEINRQKLDEELQTRLLDECEKLIEKAVAKGAQDVDCPSRLTKESLEKRFGPRGFYIVPWFSDWRIVFQPPPSLGQRFISFFTHTK